MAEIKWFISDRKSYVPTSICDIIYEWGLDKEIKIIRVKRGRSYMIDFILYNSEPYTRKSRSYEGVTILDRLQLFMTNNHIESEAFNSVLKEKIKGVTGLPKKRTITKPTLENWLLDYEIEEIMDTINSLLNEYDLYTLMDELTG